MLDPFNDPLKIWHCSNTEVTCSPVRWFDAGQIVIESEDYAKRIAAEFMLDLAAGCSFSGVSFKSHPKTFVIKWESPLPKQTKKSLGQVFKRLSETFGSSIAGSYASWLPKMS